MNFKRELRKISTHIRNNYWQNATMDFDSIDNGTIHLYGDYNGNVAEIYINADLEGDTPKYSIIPVFDDCNSQELISIIKI